MQKSRVIKSRIFLKKPRKPVTFSWMQHCINGMSWIQAQGCCILTSQTLSHSTESHPLDRLLLALYVTKQGSFKGSSSQTDVDRNSYWTILAIYVPERYVRYNFLLFLIRFVIRNLRIRIRKTCLWIYYNVMLSSLPGWSKASAYTESPPMTQQVSTWSEQKSS